MVTGWPLAVASAVMARMLGVGSKLEVASRQLSVTEKLDVGMDLIRLFSIPHEGYEAPSIEFIQAHQETAAACENGKWVEAAASGHYPPITEPDLVIREILSLVDTIRG